MGLLGLLAMLLSPKLNMSTLLLLMVFFANSFVYYGLLLLSTELNNTSSSCDLTDRPSQLLGTIKYKNVLITSFAEELPGLVLSALMVDRFGGKTSLAAMLLICCFFMLPLVVHQPDNLISLLFGARACMTATMTVGFLYAPEGESGLLNTCASGMPVDLSSGVMFFCLIVAAFV